MKVLVQAKNIAVTPAIAQAVTRQAQKLGRLSHKIRKVSAFLEIVERKKNDYQSAKVLLKVDWPGKDLVIERTAFDLYEAIVDASERACRAVRKAKEKRRNERIYQKMVTA
jgi:ribosomal subunit interface protein